MCGRFSNSVPVVTWAHLLKTVSFSDGPPVGALRRNVAPGERVWMMDGPSRVLSIPWGWRAPWGKSRLLINARVETLGERATFRNALNQRGLILADAFYEWKREAGRAVPFRIEWSQEGPFFLAALWLDGPEGRAAVILTEAATGAMAALHDRQPVVLPLDARETWWDPIDWRRWLDPEVRADIRWELSPMPVAMNRAGWEPPEASLSS